MDCFILAGGESRRFGEDKILFKIGKKRTVDYVIETAKKVCDRVALVVKDKEKFKDLGVEVFEDLLPERSPIVGILTALKVSESPKVLILGGDMPLVKEEVLRILVREFEEPATLFKVNGKLQTLLGVYSKGVANLMEDYVRKGGRSIVGFLESISFKTLDEKRLKDADPELLSFTNLNTKKDLNVVLERLSWT